MEEVTITERGWSGHFIGSKDCNFRRNTLIEYKDKKWIVSTVGNYHPAFAQSTDKPEQIGYKRFYETMAFEGILQDGYIDADVSKEINFKSQWAIGGTEDYTEFCKLHPLPDNEANNMHEAVIKELSVKIKEED